jgi:hypothetical protein
MNCILQQNHPCRQASVAPGYGQQAPPLFHVILRTATSALTSSCFELLLGSGSGLLDILDGLESINALNAAVRFPEINGVCKPSLN